MPPAALPGSTGAVCGSSGMALRAGERDIVTHASRNNIRG